MYSIPRGPLYLDGETGSPDFQANYIEKMMAWRESARAEAVRTSRLNPEIGRIPQYIDWLQGNQWDVRRPRYRSSFYDNRLDMARTDTIAMLTSGKPSIEVTTAVDGYEQQADIVRNVIQAEWLRQSMDLQLALTIDICLLWGTSFVKIASAMPGVTRIIPCGPDNVMPIQPPWDIQGSTAILYQTWKPVSWYKRVFPYRSVDIEREATSYDIRSTSPWQRPTNIDEYTWNAMSPQMRRVMGTRGAPAELPARSMYLAVQHQEYYIEDYSINESNKTILVKDQYLPSNSHNYWYFVKPGQRLYPRKRLVVFAGRRLMYDGPSPYWHGLFPFACLRLDPVPWSFWGKSYYRNLFPINAAINEIGAGTMDLVKRALNPVAITKESAVPITAWKEFFTDMPGAKLRMGPMGNPSTDLRYMEQPPIPTWVPNFLQGFLMPEFDKLSGAVDITQLTQKRQAPGGDTIEAMKDSMQIGIQLKSRRIENFLLDVGQQLTSNVFQFYTSKQRMKMMGASGVTLQDFDYDPSTMIPNAEREKESHWRNFSLVVLPGSLHSGAKDRDRQVAMALYKMQVISRKRLLEILEISDADQMEQEIYNEVAAMRAAMQGQPPGEDPLANLPPDLRQVAEVLMAGVRASGNSGGGQPQPAPGGGAGGPTPAGAPPGESPTLTRGARNGQPV